MKLHTNPAQMSEIIAAGERLRKLSIETGKKYLMCQRGINSVCNLDLTEVIKQIDFNSTDLQVYPNNSGRLDLRHAINHEYFKDSAKTEQILIVNGAIAGIDMTVQTLDVEEIVVPAFHWGSYLEIMKMRNVHYSFYENLEWLKNNIETLKNKAVIVCDPNNPLGNKVDDNLLWKTVKLLNDNEITVIFDCPYRRVFTDSQSDDLFQKLLALQNVIIIESFSKSLGISGLRLGFIHSTDKQFVSEINKRILYQTNGICTFSQLLVRELLTSDAGKLAVINFKQKTVEGIQQNINLLRNLDLLAEEFYRDSEPVGIFAIVNRSEETLLQHQIGSVSLAFFTKTYPQAEKFARVCVSMPPTEFKAFFEKVK
jgi:aspartate aminotransferase